MKRMSHGQLICFKFMDIFFGKMGITDLKYKPAYNPCTLVLCIAGFMRMSRVLETSNINILVP